MSFQTRYVSQQVYLVVDQKSLSGDSQSLDTRDSEPPDVSLGFFMATDRHVCVCTVKFRSTFSTIAKNVKTSRKVKRARLKNATSWCVSKTSKATLKRQQAFYSFTLISLQFRTQYPSRLRYSLRRYWWKKFVKYTTEGIANSNPKDRRINNKHHEVYTGHRSRAGNYCPKCRRVR